MDQERFNKAVELRHELHAHPELSEQEVWTKERLKRYIRENSVLEVCDMGPYFYAVYHSQAEQKRPAIALRADFDALPMEDEIDKPYRSQCPGVGHKCGHDGHSATLSAFASELADLAPDRDVYLIFQHAEENGAGAVVCQEVIKQHPDIGEVYGMHNQTEEDLGLILTRSGTINCASKGMSIRMTGTPTHASLPEKGRNPVFALANVVRAIPEIADPANATGLLLCTVVQLDVGDYAFGMAASDGVLRCTIRAEREEEMDELQRQLEALSRAEAERYGLTVTFTYEDVFPENRNHPENAEKVLQAARELGLATKVLADPYKGSEDFGYYTKLVPGAFFFIGNGADSPSFHTSAYDFNDEVISYGVAMFSKLVTM